MAKGTKRSGKIIKKLRSATSKVANVSRQHVQENLIDRVDNVFNAKLAVFEWVLLAVAILLFAVVQSFFYANALSSTVFVPGGTYVEGTIGRINSLNPLYATTSSEKTVAKLLFSSLTFHDTSGNVGMRLARSITSKDAKTWTVTMREGLSWSDGEPITASDVVATFKFIQDDNAKTAYAGMFPGVLLEQISDTELNFTLSTPFAGFPAALDFPIIPAHIIGEIKSDALYEHSFSQTPVCSGPFILNSIQSSSAGAEQRLLLDPNPHTIETPMLSHIAIHTYSDTNTLLRAIDFLDISATADLSQGEKPSNPNIYTRETAINRGYFLFLNTESDLMKQRALRQALSSALDRDTLREQLGASYGLNYPIQSTRLELDFPAPFEFDSEEADKLVDSLKIKDWDALPPIRIATLNTYPYIDIADFTKAALESLGFSVDIHASDAQNLILNYILPREYDILVYNIDLGLDPDQFAYYHSASIGGSGLNFSNWRDVLVDDALLTARGTLDEKIRTTKYNQFLQRWASEVPSIPLFKSTLTYHYSRIVRPFSENITLVAPLDRFVDVPYWATTKDSRLRTP